jgi:hypothetical protein
MRSVVSGSRVSTGGALSLRSAGQNNQRTLLCEVSAFGVYPVLSISDIRSEGLSKQQLWQNFSLEKLNQALVGDVLKIGENLPVSRSMNKRSSHFEFDFGAKLNGSVYLNCNEYLQFIGQMIR